MGPELIAWGIYFSVFGSFGLGVWLTNRHHEKKRKITEEWIDLKGAKFSYSPDYPYTAYKTVKSERGI